MKKLSLVIAITVLIDRIFKILVSNMVNSVKILGDFFKITLMHNYGAAWSMLNGYRLFLIVVALVELFLIFNLFIKGKKLKSFESVTFGLLIGGIIGNLIDRLVYGYVIDFLDFNIFGYNFPVFNFADAVIVISIGMLIYLIYKGELDGSR